MTDPVDVAQSPQVLAAIWLAGGAVVVGLINVAVTLWQGHLTRSGAASLENREQWWGRFVWAAERATSPAGDDKELGATVLGSLATVDWIEASDRDLIDAILAEITDEVSAEEVEEAADEQNH